MDLVAARAREALGTAASSIAIRMKIRGFRDTRRITYEIDGLNRCESLLRETLKKYPETKRDPFAENDEATERTPSGRRRI